MADIGSSPISALFRSMFDQDLLREMRTWTSVSEPILLGVDSCAGSSDEVFSSSLSRSRNDGSLKVRPAPLRCEDSLESRVIAPETTRRLFWAVRFCT